MGRSNTILELIFLGMVSMTQGKRSRLSATQKTDVRKPWKAGQMLHEIGRAHGKPHPSIRCVLLPCGGIAPAARRRSGLALTLAEREDISRGSALRDEGSLFALHFLLRPKAP